MAGYKGVGIVFVRAQARAAGCEGAVLAALSPAASETWRQATASGWYPIEHATEMFTRAAPLLFPGSASPLRELGRATCTSHDRSALVELHEYPDCPERFRECVCGWIAGAVEVCGGTNARVLKEDGSPFVWRVTWR
ncbi:MAG: hypothetical protein EOO75_09280 [Myxococcales bacterium]|nr:MAG: hypothetical protein EOO75_09280 [Myxococcales bacterium]